MPQRTLTLRSKGEEYPRAYLVLKEDRQLKPDDVHKFMDSRVARHKKLVGGVAFVDAIPKNPVSFGPALCGLVRRFADVYHTVWQDTTQDPARAGRCGNWRHRCQRSEAVEIYIMHLLRNIASIEPKYHIVTAICLLICKAGRLGVSLTNQGHHTEHYM